MRRRSRRREANSAADADLCEHLQRALDAKEPRPLTPDSCQDCTELGEDVWAHLRLCLSCGHVACCDSSPHRHATAHHQHTGHPVMRSAEPGETWRWCYVDARLG